MARSVEVKILGDADPLRRSLAGASRNVKEFEGGLGKAGRGALSASGAFSHLGRSIAFASGAFLGAAGFTSVVKQSVEGAMSLERELAKTRAVFGDNTKAVDTWSKTTARSFGVSRAEALKSANLFGQMAHALGLTSRQGVEMSRVLTELAPKLALFAGKSTEEASAALAGGLAGRTRALKEYGIVIDSTTLKAEALRLGLVKSAVDSRKVALAQDALSIAVAKAAAAHQKYGENTTQVHAADDAVTRAHMALERATSGVAGSLTAAAKAQAFFSLVQGQSRAASETWRREQGSGEVQIKRLQAELKDTEVTIGQALLPTVVAITGRMADWLGQSKNQALIQRDVNKVVKVAGTLLHDLHDVVKALSPVVQGVNRALGGTKNSMELLIGLAVVAKLSRWAAAFKALAGAEGIAGVVTAIRGKGGLMAALNSLPASKLIAIRLVGVAGAILALKQLGDALFHAGDNAAGMKAARQVGINDTLANMLNNPTAAFRAWARQWALNNGRGDIAFGLLIDDPKFNKAARAWVTKHSLGGGVGGATATQDANARRGVSTSEAGTGIQQGLVSTASTALGNPYKWGGNPSLSSPTDCSGLMVAVFSKHGISLPRTSQQQYAQAPIKNRKPLLAGDLVFSEGIHPGHVGLYIGSGQVLEDPHTGDHVKVVSLQGFGWNGESARWWGGKASAKSGGGGGTTTGAIGGGTTDTGGGGGLTVGSTTKPPGWKGATVATIISAKASVTAMLTQANDVIGGMAGPMDAIERAAEDHLNKLKAHLHPHMTAADLARTRAEIAKWGKVLSDEIGAQTKAAQRAFDAASKKMFRSFDEATADHERTFQRETEDHLRQMGADFARVMKAFDAETAAGMAARAAPALTPTEMLLQARSAARQAADLQKALTDAQKAGDPAAIAQAQYDIETAALERQAAAERAAADAAATAAQAAYGDERQTLSDALQEQERIKEQDYQDSRDAQDRAYQDMRDDQRAQLQQNLDDWNQWLSDKKKSWNEFWAWVKANPNGGGVIPNLGDTSTAPGFGGTGGGTVPAGMPGSGATTEGGPSIVPIGGGNANAMTVGTASTFVFHFPNYVGSQQELAATVRRELLRMKSRNVSLGF